jgi:hypothetical protein
MPHGIERKPGEPVCDELRLSRSSRGKGSVVEAVLRKALLTNPDQI